jgi:broad specificity phosphatase PhoE
MRRRCTLLLAALLAAVMVVLGPVGASPIAHAVGRHTIVLTLIRHGESTANAEGVIDTSVPGPDITPVGDAQAIAVANEFSPNRYDGIYASPMIRTQETAAPLAQALGEPVTVLPGLREIEAGANEGRLQATAPNYPAPGVWLHGDRAARIPGSITGNEFESRFSAAVKTVYDSGQTNPVVFSHGEAIMYWVLMTTKNADLSLANNPLPNTAHVVVTGNPTDGWTLADWNGTPTPSHS